MSGCGVEWLCEGKENEENQSLFSLFDPVDDVIMTRGRVRSGGAGESKDHHDTHLFISVVVVSLRRKRRQEESEMRIKGEIMCQRVTKKEDEKR